MSYKALWPQKMGTAADGFPGGSLMVRMVSQVDLLFPGWLQQGFPGDSLNVAIPAMALNGLARSPSFQPVFDDWDEPSRKRLVFMVISDALGIINMATVQSSAQSG